MLDNDHITDEYDMQKKHKLQFSCLTCKSSICFSIFELDNDNNQISCQQCKKKYVFSDEVLKRQLKKFEALCRQIIDSEEILSNTAVGIDVGEHQVKIPYKLLLTRLSSTLDLIIGDQPITISFRIEPLRDLPIIS